MKDTTQICMTIGQIRIKAVQCDPIDTINYTSTLVFYRKDRFTKGAIDFSLLVRTVEKSD